MKKIFRSRKDVSKYLLEKGIDTSRWSEEKWLSLNKGQAEIHMMALAEAMWDAYQESTPKVLKEGRWHIPFGDSIDEDLIQELNLDINNFSLVDCIENAKIEIATAMCARVSYTVVGEEDKEPNYANDIKLHDRLLEAGHMSPFEHCGRAMGELNPLETGWSGNFKGFIQYRKTIPNENRI